MSVAHEPSRYVSMERTAYDEICADANRNADALSAVMAERDQLRSELAAYKQGAVLIADYERVRQERDSLRIQAGRAVEDIDALTRQLADAQDKRSQVALRQALRCVSRLLKLVDTHAGYTSHEEQAAIREARALLAGGER